MACKSTGGMPCDLTICPMTLTSETAHCSTLTVEKRQVHTSNENGETELGNLDTATFNDENTTSCELQTTVLKARNHRLTFKTLTEPNSLSLLKQQ